MLRSFQCLGQELAPYVLDWDKVEEVKNILLASNQMFTAEHTLTLANDDNRFTPNNSKSLFCGRDIELIPVQLSIDGVILYQGFIRTLTIDHASRTAKLVSQNAFTVPSNYFVSLTTTGNPASIVWQILNQSGLSAYVDPISFTSAQAGFASAGASIGVAYTVSGSVTSANGVSGKTALSAIQDICNLCSMSCFVQSGIIKLIPVTPYQGNLSGVKYQIGVNEVYDFRELEYAYENLSNSVHIGYGASSDYYASDTSSIRANKLETNTQFSTTTNNELYCPDLISAKYYGGLFLSRASTLRQQGKFTAGPELMQVHIGDRVTVNAPNWGSTPLVCEVLETHLDITGNSVDLTVATI